MSVAFHVPKELLKQGCDLYDSGENLAYIARLWGCSCLKTAARHLRRNGVRVRGHGESLRKWNLNESFFDAIDTEAKAYWLGFLTADGNVPSRGIRMGLKRSDREHLVAFAKAIGTDAPVRDRMTNLGHPKSVLEIASVRLSITLKKLGFGECKTERIKPWDGPAKLMCHYWRGVFDGDGSFTSPGNPQRAMELCGNKSICQGFADFVECRLGFKKNVRAHRSIFRVTYGRIDEIRAIFHLLYDNSIVCLLRKKADGESLADRQVKGRAQRRNESQWSDLFESGDSDKSIADKLNMSRGVVYNARRRLMRSAS